MQRYPVCLACGECVYHTCVCSARVVCRYMVHLHHHQKFEKRMDALSNPQPPPQPQQQQQQHAYFRPDEKKRYGGPQQSQPQQQPQAHPKSLYSRYVADMFTARHQRSFDYMVQQACWSRLLTWYTGPMADVFGFLSIEEIYQLVSGSAIATLGDAAQTAAVALPHDLSGVAAEGSRMRDAFLQ